MYILSLFLFSIVIKPFIFSNIFHDHAFFQGTSGEPGFKGPPGPRGPQVRLFSTIHNYLINIQFFLKNEIEL